MPLILLVTSLQTIASAQQTKVAVITTPFVLPAKVALLQNIAKAKKITIQGHVINTTDEDAKL
ncbi:MAG: hypothetical protein GY787_11160, partial [Alteromonadales bacterium]|nr:hypothetical protein [Alteromonadales bacterium]